MQDGKALQAGTSHFLGQNFAKAFDVKFANKEGKQDYVWATSWGVSTRLMGALIMTHSDDNGLVLPPLLAPIQVVIVPIYKGEEQLAQIAEKVLPLKEELKAQGISVKFDDRDTFKPGYKFNEYELKGVPVRIAIGARDLEAGTFELARRDTLQKWTVNADQVIEAVQTTLKEMQQNLFDQALEFQTQNTREANSYEEFKSLIETHGGFVSAHWDGTTDTEDRIKEETKATIRCIPLNQKTEDGQCIYSGNPSKGRVLFAKAY
jgi:prolyl-tRNA synthetase